MLITTENYSDFYCVICLHCCFPLDIYIYIYIERERERVREREKDTYIYIYIYIVRGEKRE